MIRYAIMLDESGPFSLNAKVPNFIAGLLYRYAEDNNTYDYDNERSHLWKRLEELCGEKGIEYPGGLHSTSNKRNRDILKDIFYQIISERNTSREAYVPLLMVQHDGLYAFNERDLLTGDKNTANLYENMLSYLLTLVLSSLPKSNDMTIVWLDLPTRTHVVGLPKGSSQEEYYQFNNTLKNFKNSGYERLEETIPPQNPDNAREVRFSVVRDSVIRMIIKNWIEQSGRNNVKVHLDSLAPKRIKFDESTAVSDQAGKYMADLFCNAVKDNLYLEPSVLRKEGKYLPLHTISNELSAAFHITSAPYIYEYTADIKQSQKLWDAFYQNDVQKVLRQIKNLSYTLPGYFYTDIFSNSENFTQSDFLKDNNIRAALAYIQSRYMEGDYDEARAMAQWIHEQKEKRDGFTSILHVKFALLEILLQTSQHLGKVGTSLEYQALCDEIRKKLNDPELDLAHKNRTISTLENEFAFKEAIQAALEIYSTKESVIHALETIYGKKPHFDLDFARISSKLGQLYSFAEDYERAEQYFQTALTYMPPTDLANRNITLSYYLHMAISSGNQALYEAYECEYFGIPSDGSRADRLLRILYSLRDAKRQSEAFAVFVFLKAAVQFYLSTKDADTHSALQQVSATDWARCGYDTKVHPFELINYYMAVLNYAVGNEAASQSFLTALSHFCNEGTTIAIISRALMLRYTALMEDTASINICYGELRKECKKWANEYPRIKDTFQRLISGCSLEQALGYFTYMYM